MSIISTNFYLTGFMATGKSSIGKSLANLLNWKHYDLDSLIEEKKNQKISKIFENDGEVLFRKYELEEIQKFTSKKRCVISLGGGSLIQENIRKFIATNGLLIWLRSNPDVILERINRKNTRPIINKIPFEKRLDFIKNLLEERKEFYKTAQLFIDTDNTNHKEIAENLLQKINIHQSIAISVKTPQHSYPIYIENSAQENTIIEHNLLQLTQHNNCPNMYFVVVDSQIKKHHPKLLQKISHQLNHATIFEIDSLESNKNLLTVERIITKLLQKKFPRKTTLVALGGGIIGDITGFVASIYLRGVYFIQIPTTLLAMVDSSIGGKTGVNHTLGKNFIGSFYQPQIVLSDIYLLTTLPHNEYLAGLAEVIKYSIIWDLSFFNFLKNNTQNILNKDTTILKKVIKQCCEIKALIVNKDEKEQNLRMILNYGHTFAHAIEVTKGFNSISHGLAVALGMRVAGRVATIIGTWKKEDEDNQTKLLDDFQMPKVFNIDKKKVWESILRDKKVNANQNPVFIIPTRIGHVVRKENISKEIINKAWSVITPESIVIL